MRIAHPSLLVADFSRRRENNFHDFRDFHPAHTNTCKPTHPCVINTKYPRRGYYPRRQSQAQNLSAGTRSTDWSHPHTHKSSSKDERRYEDRINSHLIQCFHLSSLLLDFNISPTIQQECNQQTQLDITTLIHIYRSTKSPTHFFFLCRDFAASDVENSQARRFLTT